MRITVFTPAYNRGYIIGKLYDSLCRQSFRDFEWIVIDDGSTDNTEEVVREFIAQKPFFPIIYQKVSNGGKHRAWNRGLDLAAGELFYGCDSDDYLTDDALEVIDRMEKSIPEERKKEFAGVCGLKGYQDSTIVGTTFAESGYMDMTHLERTKNKIQGDKSEVIYTDVWRKYKYHEFEGENFLTEATALNRMAGDGLKMRYFNTVIKIVEYLPDGLSASSRERFKNNPKGWGLYIAQRIQYGQLAGSGKWDVITDYYFSCKRKVGVYQMASNLHMNVIIFLMGVVKTWFGYKIKQ